MEFYTSSVFKRPVRLSEKTRRFAYESLNHKYGLDTRKTKNLSLRHIKDFDKLSDLEKYNVAIYEIATKAPIRVCDGELLSGAATIGDALYCALPVTVNADGEFCLFHAVSHLTVDYSEVLEIGMNGIREKAEKYLGIHSSPDKKEFIKSCIHCIDCMKIWHERYLCALSEKEGYEKNVENLKRVPFEPAGSFYEAVQCIWFCFAFLRLCGNWPGFGRIDVLLGDYLKNDLQNGILTLNEAREILAHFFIKGCEWIDGSVSFPGGDAQHYQNLVISGTDENGNDVTNEVTYLVLDIIEETGISDFPTTIRINRNTNDKLLNRAAEVISFGGGTVAIYNEELILESLKNIGYSEKEAVTFANDGCWEVQIPGKTHFSYRPFDALKILQHQTLSDYDGSVSFDNFEDLFDAFENDLKNQVQMIFEDTVLSLFKNDSFDYVQAEPCSLISIFEHPCIERGLSYHEGGTKYRVLSPHIGGLPDVANSLYAIKKAVFDDKIISFSDFMRVLQDNWEDDEFLRRKIMNGYTYFGNDNDEVDSIAARLLSDFSDMCMEYDGKTPVRFVSGVSTFGRQLEWAPSRIATPFGRKKGEILSGNLSPTPGTDKLGATAIIKSYCKADLKKQYTGAALDIGLIPPYTNTRGYIDGYIDSIKGLIKGFVTLGGYFMQIDSISRARLLEAQKHPENFPTLSVRVSGWNARFVTMTKEWQDMIIERSK